MRKKKKINTIIYVLFHSKLGKNSQVKLSSHLHVSINTLVVEVFKKKKKTEDFNFET